MTLRVSAHEGGTATHRWPNDQMHRPLLRRQPDMHELRGRSAPYDEHCTRTEPGTCPGRSRRPERRGGWCSRCRRRLHGQPESETMGGVPQWLSSAPRQQAGRGKRRTLHEVDAFGRVVAARAAGQTGRAAVRAILAEQKAASEAATLRSGRRQGLVGRREDEDSSSGAGVESAGGESRVREGERVAGGNDA